MVYQYVEHLMLNQQVGGSSPSTGFAAAAVTARSFVDSSGRVPRSHTTFPLSPFQE
jgi:hypothetical protein